MERNAERQYDDDLTVGVDEEYDDFVETDDVDLFEFFGEDESSISKLKSIMLSIDWEITDENLTDFSEELLVLKDEQVNDKINLVYIQALEKLVKYIFKEKSNANHNGLKLFQSFFYTLEKNIISNELSAEDKKKVLIEDVKKFEKLKSQIEAQNKSRSDEPSRDRLEETEFVSPRDSVAFESDFIGTSPIMNLKAIILGMDWEITDKELSELGVEVKRLEEQFKDSKPKMIFLQGIGALGAYIKKKKSNAHADAFKLLHSFCVSLEKITEESCTYEEEKAILLPEVDKFNEFKRLVADTIATEGSAVSGDDFEERYESVAPAFSDMDEEVVGFQVDEEAAKLRTDDKAVSERIDSFFEEDSDGHSQAYSSDAKNVVSHVDSFFDQEETGLVSSEQDVFLQGVDVETEADDESDEEPLPILEDGALAPALAGDEDAGLNSDQDGDGWEKTEEANKVFEKIDSFFDVDEKQTTTKNNEMEAMALKGVDVETDADDESDEDPLPLDDTGEFEPALSLDGDTTVAARNDDTVSEDVEESIADFFDDDDVVESSEVESDSLTGEEQFVDDDSFNEKTEDDVFVIEDDDAFESVFDEDDAEVPAAALSESEPESFNEFVDTGEVELDVLDEAIQDDASGLATIDEESELFDFTEEPELDDQQVFSDGVTEEEVVAFELAEDDSFPENEEKSSVGGNLFKAALAAKGATELSKAFSGREPKEQQFEMKGADEEYSAIFEEVEEAKTDDQVSEKDVVESQEEKVFAQSNVQNAIVGLRENISRANEQFDSDVIHSLQSEIRDLSEKWDDYPVGKTFLQLMTTIVENMERCHYQEDNDAHSVLLSVFDKVEKVVRGDVTAYQAQEFLFSETSKVLQWQQKMIDSQVVKEDANVFSNESHNVTDDEQEMDRFVFNEKDIVESNENFVVNDKEISLIRHEIQSLKESFKEEINTLRSQLKTDR